MKLIEPNPPGIVRPYPGGQTIYLSRPEHEVLFGGSAGPGKSLMLILDAMGLQFEMSPIGKPLISVPKYRAIIFRRQSNQLSELIDMGQELYRPFGAVYRAKRTGDPGPSFTFPLGARIFLGYMESLKDMYNFQGLPFQFIGFDELTQFLLKQYLYMFSRARTTDPDMPVRIRATTNPIGPGLIWVRKRFPITQPCKTLAYLPAKDPLKNPAGIHVPHGMRKSKTRAFVPGVLAENPSIQEGYRENIEQMGDQYVRALLKNDWNAFSGDFFPWQPEKEIKPFEIPSRWRLVGCVDPGWSSYCAFILKAIDFEGNVYNLFSYYERNRSGIENARAVKAMLEEFPHTKGRMPDMIVAGADAFQQKDKFAIISNDATWSEQWAAVGLHLLPAGISRKMGWWATKDLMQNNRLFVFLGYNSHYINEVMAAVADDNDEEDIAGKGNDKSVMDHLLDADRYGNVAAYKPMRPPKSDSEKTWQERLRAAQSATADGWKVGQG